MNVLGFALAMWLFSITVAGTVEFTNTNYDGITVGEPFTITWTGATSDVTLKLINGPASNPTPVLTIATGLTGISYTWTPDTSIHSGVYAFEILNGEDVNYSVQFTISGATTVQTSTAASSSDITQTITPPSTTSSLTPFLPTLSSPQTTPLLTTSLLSTTTPSTTTTPSLTGASSASSSTSSVQPISDSGLGTGAKAGIGVGVVLGLAIIVFIIWLIFRRRRTQRDEGTRRDAENKDSKFSERGSEMMTSANTHEIDGKPTTNPQIVEVEGQVAKEGEKLESQHIPPTVPEGTAIDNDISREIGELKSRHSQNLPELDSEEKYIPEKAIPSEMPTQSSVQEMTAATNIGSDWEHLHPSELDSKAVDKPIPELPVPIAPLEPPSSAPAKLRQGELIEETSTGTPVIPSTDTSPDELETLQKRIEQVRADKERLERIQQLKDLESELQRDILAAQKRKQEAASSSS